IGAGMSRLGMARKPRSIPEKQAVAAVGQGILMQTYESLFADCGYVVGQLLLTRDDLTHRKRHLNCRNTIESLWRMGAIPIVNENDTVAVEEIKFGDNDTLAALVAGLIAADLLIILSDVDGVYDKNPRLHPSATLLQVVEAVTPELMEAAGGPGSLYGSGGMVTKLQAAKMAMAGGTAAVIANGARPGVIRSILEGETAGTLFVPRPEKMAGRMRWIAFYLPAQGQIRVDGGARKALVEGGKSLLAAGIVGVSGQFEEGDVVQVLDEDGRELARGLVNYGAEELARIQGRSTQEIHKILGYKYFDEVIHRDNLVLSVGEQKTAPGADAPEAPGGIRHEHATAGAGTGGRAAGAGARERGAPQGQAGQGRGQAPRAAVDGAKGRRAAGYRRGAGGEGG